MSRILGSFIFLAASFYLLAMEPIMSGKKNEHLLSLIENENNNSDLDHEKMIKRVPASIKGPEISVETPQDSVDKLNKPQN
ncbi:MAG: hypothetical protein H6621_02060 [Halobacteriovoraceae bacterium]|nr:hypothetical protein [Halobacteriovoraceae bacterium]